MKRVLEHRDFLWKLLTSSAPQFILLIRKSSEEEIKTVFECLINVKSHQSVLTQLKAHLQRQELSKLFKVFKQYRCDIKAAIAIVLTELDCLCIVGGTSKTDG